MKTENTLRKRFYQTQNLKAHPEKIFPLLCPVREYEWVERWECKMVYTNSGFAEENCIFTTKPNNEEPEDIWVVSKYKPPREIQFVRTNGFRVIRYNISLKPNSGGTSFAEWEQIITGLNTEGNSYVEKLVEDDFKKMIESLENMLNYYLEKGKMLKFDLEI